MITPQDALPTYWVGKQIGQGARSLIYKVSRRTDGEVFAAKFVAVREPDDLRIVGHLENEYRVLSRLHGGEGLSAELIVRPVELCRVRKLFQTRAACLIMEYVAGESIAERSDYPLAQMLDIFQQVCAALEHIHSAELVHADLKPNNILVQKDMRVKLIDFGFTLPVGTKLHGYKGTWGYLAPEQAGGQLSLRTDVFNLGAVMYQVFTGQKLPSILPAGSERTGFVPYDKLVLTPPSQIRADLPADLSDLIMRCCALREHRRPTVEEARRSLKDLLLRLELGM